MTISEMPCSPRWRRVWLWANAVGSFGASLLWGIGLANLLYGTPINSHGDFDGTFWVLFNAYTVLAGVAVVAVFAFHGATYLTLRTQGDLLERAGAASGRWWSPSTATTRACFRRYCPPRSGSPRSSSRSCLSAAAARSGRSR